MENETKNLIDKLGGAPKVASLCEITPQAVYQWIDDNAIPKARMLYFKALRPELFEEKKVA